MYERTSVLSNQERMSGKRISETALSTSPSGMTAKGRRMGHDDPIGGTATIANWFDISEIVEKVLSYLENPYDIECAAMVSKTFQKCSWQQLVTKDLEFCLDLPRRILGPFVDFSVEWEPSHMTDYIPIMWSKCPNLRSLDVRVNVRVNAVSRESCDDFLLCFGKLQLSMKRKIEVLRFHVGALLSPAFPPLIELCSDTLTQLGLFWFGAVSSDNNVQHGSRIGRPGCQTMPQSSMVHI